MWLVEAIPKMDKSREEESVGSDALLQRSITAEVADRLKQAWIPAPFLRAGGVYSSGQSWHYRGRRSHHAFATESLTAPAGAGDVSVRISKDTRRYLDTLLPFVTQQPADRQEVAPSLLSENSHGVVAAQEWEQEWNTSGLGSGLSQSDYKARKKQRLLSKFSEQMKAASQRASREEGDSLERLVEAFSRGVQFSSRFSNQAKFAEGELNTAETEEALQQRREEELAALRAKVAELSASIGKMEVGMKSYETNIKQLEGKLGEEQAKTRELEAAYKIKKRTYDLLDDPDKNIANLRAGIDESSRRMIELATQWEAKRVPLIEAYRSLRERKTNRLAESRRQLERIKEFREQLKELEGDVRSKNDFQQQLLDEYEKLPKDVQRSQYTERIMEIVRNIQKQNVEISKVLLDTRQVQKEISQTIDQLNRTYSAADELVYRDAKTNDFSKKSYKLLVGIHDTCAKISDTTSDTGQTTNTSKELEDKIDQLMAEKTTAKLERIQADVEQVRTENRELLQKIKKAQAGF